MEEVAVIGFALIFAMFFGLGIRFCINYFYKRGGDGPAFIFFILIALGSSGSIFFSNREINSFESNQNPLANYISQAATLVILFFSMMALLFRFGNLQHPFRLPSSRLWLSYISFFFLETILASIFGAIPTWPGNNLYSLLVFTALFVFPPTSIEKFTRFAKLSILCILYFSVVAIFIAPSIVIEDSYSGFLPGISFRLHGLTPHANIFALVGLMYLLLDYMVPGKGWLHIVNISLALATFIFSQSKTVWVAALACFIVILLFRDVNSSGANRRSKIIKTVALRAGVFSCITLLLFLGASDFIMGYVSAADETDSLTSFTGRTLIWGITYSEFLKSPLFGFGLSLWDFDFRNRYGLLAVGQAHNQLIQTMGTGGFFGLIGLLIYSGTLLLVALKYVVVSHGFSLAIVLLLFIHSFSESPLRTSVLLAPSALIHLIVFGYLIVLMNKKVIK